MGYFWIIGCGDIGRRVAIAYAKQPLFQQGDVNIRALVKHQSSKQACEALGLETIIRDLDDEHCGKRLKGVNDASLFYFAPPPKAGRKDTRLSNFLDSMEYQPKRIVMISTTGVYGDSKGEWIDESFAVNPEAERAHRRLSAEGILKQWAEMHNKEYIILRVPGIYAQDRLPLARLKKGLPIVKQSEAGWTNRIHADDLANVCIQAMASRKSGEVYNVTDGHPSTMTEYFNQVADASGLDRPPQISMQEAEETLSAGMVSYLKESRRISNQKMLNELDVKLMYPSLSDCFK